MKIESSRQVWIERTLSLLELLSEPDITQPEPQHLAQRLSEVLPGEQVDGEVEGGVDDHEELHGGSDEHVPEGGVVHAPVLTCQDAADVCCLVYTGHQSGTIFFLNCGSLHETDCTK